MARILVIDESSAMRRLLRIMLKGHEVVEARFGLEAKLMQDCGPFELIICDMELPDMPAGELFSGLVTDGYDGPVLFLAAAFEDTPRDRFGARLPYLLKPVEAEVLLKKVETLIEAGKPQWDAK